VKDMNISNNDTLVDLVEINHNMLCARMLDRVGRELDHADIVTVDEGSIQQGLCNS
jgi:hypothetical protein